MFLKIRIVRRIRVRIYFTKCGKDFSVSRNEAYNIKIKIRVGGILKIFCFCSYANMAASDKGISLKRKF